MTRLDEELAQAVAESESADAAPGSERPVVAAQAGSPPDRQRRKRLQNVGLLVALLVMGVGILAVVMTGFQDAAVYSKGVDELVAERGKLSGRNVRVAGTLVKGTLKRRDEPCEYRFSIQKNTQQLDVRYAQCVVPDTFRDLPGMDVEVTAEGKLTEDGWFEANQIMAKCPSKYDMKDKAARGEKAPHDDVAATAAPR